MRTLTLTPEQIASIEILRRAADAVEDSYAAANAVAARAAALAPQAEDGGSDAS